MDLNIPESGNGRSDYLDELKYELDWVLTMQDEDGGVFHKLTIGVSEHHRERSGICHAVKTRKFSFLRDLSAPPRNPVAHGRHPTFPP